MADVLRRHRRGCGRPVKARRGKISLDDRKSEFAFLSFKNFQAMKKQRSPQDKEG